MIPAMQRLYLDWNATTPPHPDVIAAMQCAAEQAWANPSSVHEAGRRARALIEGVREQLAAFVGCHPRDVVFTSGGTEANNLAVASARALVTSRIEHPSVVRAAEQLEASGAPVRWLDVPATGRIEPEQVSAALTELPTGATVALMAANHETGVIQPVAEVFERVRAAGARLHVDAVQAAGKLDPAAWRAADSMALAAHKLRGPKGLGVLVWRGNPGEIRSRLVGGAQERGIRPGTLDPVAVAGLGAALARLDALRAATARLAVYRDRFERELSEQVLVNGGEASRLPHVSNVSCRGFRGDEIVAALDLLGIAISSGSACSAGTTEASPVITAMLGHERATSAIRVSFGETNVEADADRLISGLFSVLTRRSSRA